MYHGRAYLAIATVLLVATPPAAPAGEPGGRTALDPVVAQPEADDSRNTPLVDPATVDPVFDQNDRADVAAESSRGHRLFTTEQQAEIDRLIADALTAEPNLAKGLRFGYENGFVVTSDGGMKLGAAAAPFWLRVNSWFQFRHTRLKSHAANPDQNDFEFERLRLTLQGNVYTPDLRYFIQLDGDGDQGEMADWLDYYLTYDFGHAVGLHRGTLGMKIGKWKLPFNRARAESGWKMAFADRSVASVFFDINRSQAVALFGELGLLGRTIRWESAVSNGFNNEGARPIRVGDLDRNFGYATRVWSDWIGQWGRDGESDLSYHKRLAIRVGGGFALTQVDREGAREFSRQRVVDSGQTLVTLLPASTSSYQVGFYSVDANWKYRGATVLTEYYFRSINKLRGADLPSLFDHGFMLQTGFFLCREKLELIGRWSRIVGNSGTLGAVRQSADDLAAGVVWYFKGHRAKLTFDVTRLNGAPIRDPSLNVLPGDDGFLYRTQMQLYF